MNSSKSSIGSRGQASFEFILVLLFVLTVVIVLILPLGQSTQHALEDVFRASTLSSNFAQLDSALDLARIQGSDSLQPLEWYLPKDSNVSCHIALGAADTNRISMTVTFNKKIFNSSGITPAGCVDDSGINSMPCTKSIIIPSTLALNCDGTTQGSFVNAEEKGFGQAFALRYIPTSPPASKIPTIDFSVR